MGAIKNLYLEYIERGYGECDKLVCRDCVESKSLQKFISDTGHISTCDYCHKRRKVVTIEDLMEPIMSGIRFSYDLAVNCLPYTDGEYIGTTYTSQELISEIYDELMISDENIIDDIINTMYDNVWCRRDPFGENSYETELYSWHSFCRLVKYSVRYVFTKVRIYMKTMICQTP